MAGPRGDDRGRTAPSCQPPRAARARCRGGGRLRPPGVCGSRKPRPARPGRGREPSSGGARPALRAAAGSPGPPARGRLAAESDFDLDGRTDLVAVGTDGNVYLVRNRTATANRWLRVALRGTKNLRLAPGAEVEVKAGSLYQKRIYDGVPLTFGLRESAEVDTVRITWPNGLIQNEPLQKADRLADFKEAQRLAGSCPMIFAWNGDRFGFVAEVLGVAPLGAAAGDGSSSPSTTTSTCRYPALRCARGVAGSRSASPRSCARCPTSMPSSSSRSTTRGTCRSTRTTSSPGRRSPSSGSSECAGGSRR